MLHYGQVAFINVKIGYYFSHFHYVHGWHSGFIFYFCIMKSVIAIYNDSDYNEILRQAVAVIESSRSKAASAI